MRFRPSRSQYKFSPRTFLLGMAVVAVMVYAHHRFGQAFEYAEFWVSDLRMYSRSMPKPGGEVVIAAIDDKSIAELGQWPWPRSVLARFERALIDYNAAIVGYDVLFSEADGNDVERASIAQRLKPTGAGKAEIAALLGESNDQAFADAIKAHGATIMGYSLGSLTFGGRSQGFRELGFTAEMQSPPPAAYNVVRRAPPGASPRSSARTSTVLHYRCSTRQPAAPPS